MTTTATKKINLSTPIERVENISREEFQEKYMKPQKPVIIKHLYGKDAPVYQWTFDYFEKELGHIEVGVYDDESEERQDDRSYKQAGKRMKFKDYLDIIRSGPTTKRLFLFNVFKHKKELHNDFHFPNIADNVLRFLPLAFFGGQGAVTRIHFDMDNSCVFLTELTGRKRVVMFPPEASPLLYRYPFSTHTSIDVNNPDFDRYPALGKVKGIDCVIEAGDTIFMPAGWWHHIEYITPGLGFAVRSLSPYYSHRFAGFLKVGLLTHIDDLFNKFFGKNWFAWKINKADKNAERAMA